MKSFITVLALCLLVVTPAFAQEVRNADQEKLVAELERTKEKFLHAVEGLSEAQWNFKAAPDKWSIAQCAEHIAASESLIRGAVEGALKTPLEQGTDMASLVKDEMIAKGVVDRSKKFNAPEPLVPTNRFHSPAASIEEFKTQRAKSIELAQGPSDFRAHAAKHPAFGMVDTYGFMLLLSGHSERHTLQIEEVKANPDFPKK